MAAQSRGSLMSSRLPGVPQKVAVAVLRDAHDPGRRVRDPVEIHHRQQMGRHWIHDPGPGGAASHGAASEPAARSRWQRELQDTRQRRARELDLLRHDSGDDLSPDSRPFGRQLQDARQRSRRLHTDATDLEGPGKFHEVRSAAKFTRELVMDDPMCGFQGGETVVLRPGGDTTPRGDRQEDPGERPDCDFCFVAGKAGRARFVEVIFYSDGCVAEVEAERLAKIGRAEVMRRKHQLKAAALGFGTTSDTRHGIPRLRASGDEPGQGPSASPAEGDPDFLALRKGARRSSRRSVSLPGIRGPQRRETEPSGRGLAMGKAWTD